MILLLYTELCWQRCLVRSIIVTLVIIFAEVLPRFDLVMGIIGGVLTGPITLIFPPLLYVRLRKLLQQETNQRNAEKVAQKKAELAKESFLVKIECETKKIFQKTSKNRSILSSDFKYYLENSMRYLVTEVDFKANEMSSLEVAFAFFIAGVGILQTVTATYYSTKGAIQSTKFLPPCIVDVDAASGIIHA